jgi:hypothetical protein
MPHDLFFGLPANRVRYSSYGRINDDDCFHQME